MSFTRLFALFQALLSVIALANSPAGAQGLFNFKPPELPSQLLPDVNVNKITVPNQPLIVPPPPPSPPPGGPGPPSNNDLCRQLTPEQRASIPTCHQ
jgi:hypothetical protein